MIFGCSHPFSMCFLCLLINRFVGGNDFGILLSYLWIQQSPRDILFFPESTFQPPLRRISPICYSERMLMGHS
ncbi:hypothetical protein QR685DRAFT_528247 [Neurospora intermedia]|uniref:Uncharacterized protein n=1 Tax=Neurospora intermedia TaxID=5142 RepID=A0ABR3DBQ6_NEUIN